MMERLLLILSLILFMIPSFIFAEEKGNFFTYISITLEEEKELTPDILNMKLSINVITQKEAEAINILGEVDRRIRSLSLNYVGGNYSVYKNCWWENNKRKCFGYKGDIYYSFLLKENKEQNMILDTIEEIKEHYGEKMSYTVSDPQWIISEKNLKKAETELKLQIIDTAMDFSKKVAEKLNKKCFISNIEYDTKPYYPLYKALHLEKGPIEAPEPKKQEKTISVKALIKLKCEETSK